MIDELQAYRQSEYNINSKIVIRQPTLDEVCTYGEQQYLSLVHTICATPADRKVEIWDSFHVYWDAIDEYELFISTFRALGQQDLSIIFPTLDTKSFNVIVNPKTKEIGLKNDEGVIIDRAIHSLITEYIRHIHKIKKNVEYGVNDYTKDIMIEDERDEREAASHKQYHSTLLPLISTLTSDPGFKYRYDDIWSLPVGVFMDAVSRVSRRISYNNLMTGIYTGNIDIQKINKKELNLFEELS